MMIALRRWVGRRGYVRALLNCAAISVGIQFAGYGVTAKLVDVLCGVALGAAAAAFHYQLVDGIARLCAMTRDRQRRATDDAEEFNERIRLSAVGLLAFLFTALSVLMLLRLFA
jgi:hypothetical protein